MPLDCGAPAEPQPVKFDPTVFDGDKGKSQK
jgi:hypothetical protein